MLNTPRLTVLDTTLEWTVTLSTNIEILITPVSDEYNTTKQSSVACHVNPDCGFVTSLIVVLNSTIGVAISVLLKLLFSYTNEGIRAGCPLFIF